MKSFTFHFLFTGMLFILSGLHHMDDTGLYGIFSALLMFFLGLIQFFISFVYVLKREDKRKLFLIHLFLSVVLILTLLNDNRFDIDDFANFNDHAFLLRIAPGSLAVLFLYALYDRPKRPDD